MRPEISRDFFSVQELSFTGKNAHYTCEVSDLDINRYTLNRSIYNCANELDTRMTD